MLRLGRSDQVAAGAAIVQHQLRPPGDCVANVSDLGRLDDPSRDQLDAVVGAEAEAWVEQALAVAQQHRGDVQLKLVEQPGGQHLAQELPAAGHRHVLATGGVPGQLDGPLESFGDKGEGGATLAFEHVPGTVGDDERRGVERRLLAPGDLAGVEHAPAHDIGTGRRERLLDDLRVDRLLAAGEALPLAPGHGVDGPAGDPEETGRFGAPHPATHVLGAPRVPRSGVEAVEGHRHLGGHLGHRSCSSRVGGPLAAGAHESEPTARSRHAPTRNPRTQDLRRQLVHPPVMPEVITEAVTGRG